MPITIVDGSQEYIKVEVIDNSDTPITSLSGTTPLFDTTDTAFVAIQSNVVPGVSGMFLYCLINGTLSGYVAGNKYYLYPKFSLAPESPKLGPVEFFII
jgi:hypothetical protein